jgi:hypothetical protein
MSATVFFEQANELATLTNTFKVNNVNTDPTAVTLTVTSPSGTATTYTYSLAEITRTAAGIYTKDIACSEAGVWLYLWVGTGSASDAVAGTWTVSKTTLQRLYCTPEELKSRAGIDNTDDDAEILAACTAVARGIDKWCRRQFFRHTRTRTLEPTGIYLLDVPDLVSVTTLKTDSSGDGVYETTWTTSDYQLLPADAADEAEAEPYTQIRAVGSYRFPDLCWVLPSARRNRVQIVGVWGWPAVPEGVKEAAKILAEDTWKLKDAPFGVAGEGEFTVRVGDNRRAMKFLEPYRKDPILVG